MVRSDGFEPSRLIATRMGGSTTGFEPAVSAVPPRALELASGRGLEPRLAESESAVLPLDDPEKTTRKTGAAGGIRTLVVPGHIRGSYR